MASYGWSALVSLIVLIVAWPYAQRVRHPAMSPLAAYIIFAATFAAMSTVLFGMVTSLLESTGSPATLRHPIGALGLLGLTLAPGFLLASWLIQRQPRRAPLPGE